MTKAEILNIAKPIRFNTETVRAILDGRKTVTRRVIKLPKWVSEDSKEFGTFWFATGEYGDCGLIGTDGLIDVCHLNRYDKGDYLYVKETWSKDINDDYVYRTNYGETEDDSFPPSMFKWRPSTNMPKEAARIFLKVTAVRVERLQDITWVGILHEGIKDHMITDNSAYSDICKTKDFDNYKLLWNSTLKKSDYAKYGWEANPWVWVYEFEKVEVE